MLTIVGTSTGRIFAGGRDGHIHELVYQVRSGLTQGSVQGGTRPQGADHCAVVRSRGTRRGQAEDGWFTRRCRKVNRTASVISAFLPTFLALGTDDAIVSLVHDPTRDLLYALSERSAVHVIWLGANGAEFVRAVVHTTLRDEARRLYPHTPLLDSATFRILSLHPVLRTESANVHLVAVTSNGTGARAAAAYRLQARTRPT